MSDSPATARRRRAFQCADGCFHLQWDSLILNFSPVEFAQLRAMLTAVELQPQPLNRPGPPQVEETLM